VITAVNRRKTAMVFLSFNGKPCAFAGKYK